MADLINGATTGQDAGNSFASALTIEMVANAQTPTQGSVLIDGDISSSDSADYYLFTATATGEYTITLTGLSGDLDLYLFNSQQQVITSSTLDDLSNERIIFTLTQGEEYYLIVRPFDPPTQTMNYDFSLTGPFDASFVPGDSTPVDDGEDSQPDSTDDNSDNTPDDSSDSDSKNGSKDGGDDTTDETEVLAGGQWYSDYYFGTDGFDSIDYSGYNAGDVSFSQDGFVDDIVSEDWNISYTHQVSGKAGTDTLMDIERAVFDDYTVALDLDVMDSAGIALALTHAAFGDIVEADTAGLWVNFTDDLYYENSTGLDVTTTNLNEVYVQVAQQMIQTYAPAGVSDEELMGLLSWNVLQRTLTTEDAAFYGNLLSTQQISQAELVAFAAKSMENTSQYQQSVQLTGFVYNPDSELA